MSVPVSLLEQSYTKIFFWYVACSYYIGILCQHVGVDRNWRSSTLTQHREGSKRVVGEIISGAELRAVQQAINFVWEEKWPEIRIYTDFLVVANVSASCQGPGVKKNINKQFGEGKGHMDRHRGGSTHCTGPCVSCQ